MDDSLETLGWIVVVIAGFCVLITMAAGLLWVVQ